MKKNFVKKTLASTLAFAMVATSVPAAFTTASAATKAPALNRKTKTLYINDNEIGSSYNFNIANAVKGSTYKWTTSNKAIATVNSKNGVTKAGTKTGKATITCKITFKTKKTKTLKATVTVKENATKVWVKNAPEKEIGIGASAYDFNSSFSTESGAKATDYRTWEIDAASNTAGATIDAKTGVVTTTKAGSFKVRVRAYQNKAKLAANDTVDSDWLEVKVVSSITAVAQTVTNKVKVTFDDNMKDKVKASDFVIKNKATTAVQSIKGISFSDDGKEVTIETYLNFVDAGTYTLTYAGVDKEFTTSIGEVASLTITPATVTVDTPTKVEVKAFNANGVDITSEKASSITVADSENANGWYNDSTKEITIYKVGSTAKITATYHTNKYDTTGTEIGAVKAETVITAVDKSAATYTGSKYAIQKTAPNFDKLTENTNLICVDDTDMKLFVKILGNDGKEISNYGDLSVASGDENTLLCSSTFDSSNSIALTAVKEGSTVIIVKEASTGKALFTIPVVVKAKRATATVTLDKSAVSVTKSTETAVNSTTVTATVKDQYAQEISAASVTKVESISRPSSVTSDTAMSLVSFTGKKVTVTADASTVKGSYQYKVYSGDKFTVLTVNVVEAPSTGAIGYRLDTSATEVDTSVTSTDDLTKKVTIKTLVTKGGVDVAVAASGTAVIETTNTKVTYKLTDKDGKDVTAKYLKANGDVVEFALVDATSGVAKKVPNGTYTITSTVETEKDGKWTTVTVRKQGIIVTDSQPTVKADVSTIKTSATGYEAIILDTCKFTFDGKTYAKDSNSAAYTVVVDPANVKTVGTDGTKYFISSVTVNITVADGVTVAFNADVNTTFTIGQ